jgi:hypothetical protein
MRESDKLCLERCRLALIANGNLTFVNVEFKSKTDDIFYEIRFALALLEQLNEDDLILEAKKVSKILTSSVLKLKYQVDHGSWSS